MVLENTVLLPIVRSLGLQPYEIVHEAMQNFTLHRDATVADEFWLLEHQPVFTQGQAGKREHLLETGDIPVVQSDRGGQVTYHGPGQWILYCLVDVKRAGLGIRQLVTAIEEAIIACLLTYRVASFSRPDAPGVYVGHREDYQDMSQAPKIAALGLRVKRGCSFHGLSLNVDMDLQPFLRINPCGYQGMPVTQLKSVASQTDISMKSVGDELVNQLMKQLGYTQRPNVTSEYPKVLSELMV